MTSTKIDMYRNAHGEVQKLIGANYLAWSEGMEFLLKGAGLWQIVSGCELLPQEPIIILEPTPEPPASSATKASTSTVSEPPTLSSPTNAAIIEAYEIQRHQYQIRSDSAASYIYSSLSVEARKHLSGAKEPHQIWAMLKICLDSLSRNVGIIRTHTMFLNDKMADTETISSYLARLTGYQTELAGTRKASQKLFTCHDAHTQHQGAELCPKRHMRWDAIILRLERPGAILLASGIRTPLLSPTWRRGAIMGPSGVRTLLSLSI